MKSILIKRSFRFACGIARMKPLTALQKDELLVPSSWEIIWRLLILVPMALHGTSIIFVHFAELVMGSITPISTVTTNHLKIISNSFLARSKRILAGVNEDKFLTACAVEAVMPDEHQERAVCSLLRCFSWHPSTLPPGRRKKWLWQQSALKDPQGTE